MFPKNKETNKQEKLSALFGKNVFSLKDLRETLPKSVYAALSDQMNGRKMLEKSVADAVAHAAKVWAIERGATHFTHWFQPLTNGTAEKHDSFLTLKYSSEGGNLTMEAMDSFSGSQLMQAEPDASSFPNGGMRTTFEARGYTVWDTTSPMFLREGPHGTKILYIPSIFISYKGDAMDEKTILLRSCDAISKSTVELLSMIGDDSTKRVHVTLGTEQEFFLVDRQMYSLRPDLKLASRTLFGAVPPKHQQLEDHYFGRIPSKVLAALSEAELELWKLGVPLKTRHNEVAPQQFEMAPIFEEASVAVDHNLLTMEILHKVAHRYGLKALFHEKPFLGVNGSGKHCNWSLLTDSGKNLLDPTEQPEENLAFLVILASVLLGLKRHSGLLSAAIASASNEHRLGANEAPPSIISAFLGAQLTEVVRSIVESRPPQLKSHSRSISVGCKKIDVKIAHLPEISRDATDRNRTSPFAFTGNKFEFRAVGSSQSPSFPVSMVNVATAAAMEEIIAMLKAKAGSKGIASKADVMTVVKEVLVEADSVCFEGDNYSAAWVAEATKRGLPMPKNAPEAFKFLLTSQNRAVLSEKLQVCMPDELISRYNVLCEKYVKDLLIESKTMHMLAMQQILPASCKYQKELAACVSAKADVMKLSEEESFEKSTLDKLSSCSAKLMIVLSKLNKAIKEVEEHAHSEKGAELASMKLKPLMEEARVQLDDIESNMADEHYPLPKYCEMLFF